MVTVRSVQPFERLAAVQGAEESRICDVDGVYTFRIGPDMGEVPGTLAEAVVVRDERPVLAAVVGPIESPLFSFNERVDDIRVGAGNGHADAPERPLGDPIAFDALPGGTVVVRTEESVLGAAAIERPGSAVALPHGGEENVGIAWIENDVNAAGAVVEIEDFFPGLPSIARTEDAAFRVRAVGMAESGDEGDVWVRRMNNDFADVPGVLQPDIGPGLAGVIRTIDAVAEGDISADTRFAGASIDDVGIGIRHRDAADRGCTLLFKERIPGDAAVGRFPDAAGDGAEVIGIRQGGDASDGQDPSPTKGADQAPFHASVRFRINGRSSSGTARLLGVNGNRGQEKKSKSRNKESSKTARCAQEDLRNCGTKRQMVALWRSGWKRFSFRHKLR